MTERQLPAAVKQDLLELEADKRASLEDKYTANLFAEYKSIA